MRRSHASHTGARTRLVGALVAALWGGTGCQAAAPPEPIGEASRALAGLRGGLVGLAGAGVGGLSGLPLLLGPTPLSLSPDGTFEAPLPIGPFTLSLTAPGHVPVTLAGAVPGPVPGARWLLPLVPTNAAGPDEALVAGFVVDPRGLPLARGEVTLTAAFLPGGSARRLPLDAQGAFVWRQQVPTGAARGDGPAMLAASGRSRGGWRIETTTVIQRLLRPGQAEVVILQGQAAPLHRPPRWRWEPPVLWVQLEDSLTAPEEAVLERVGGPGRPVVAAAGPDRFTLRFELPAGEAFEPGAWRLNLLGATSPLGVALDGVEAG
ncbi:MAG: hypothetical protein VKQ33_00515 [Candidatus Sericytochromatia bacterium]|nr:hypothetical protein [Candidatus Sericytochromatia bacterium]